MLPKLKGGIGLPDIYNYYLACHLTRICDWRLHANTKDWFQMENAGTQIPLHSLTWLLAKHSTGLFKDHLMIGPTLRSLHHVNKCTVLTSYPGPLARPRHNPDFSSGQSHQFLQDEWAHTQIQAEHFFQLGSLLSYETLQDKMLNSYLPFWTFLQLRH